MKIVTFNVRYNNPNDGEFSFEYRKEEIVRQINAEKPDVIGFQEIQDDMKSWMEEHLPDYMWVGHGRAADLSGEQCPVIFRKDKFKMRAFECFWLSDTPDVPGSKFKEQASFPRICNMLCLYDIEEGKSIRVYNTHFCYKSEDVRRKSLELILAKIDALNEVEILPNFIMGDWNAKPDCEEFVPITARTDYVDATAHLPGTYHGFFKEEPKKIDYIFVNDKVKTLECNFWESEEGKICLSDHHPICLICEV